MAISARALVDGFRAIVGPDYARDDVATRERAALDGVVPQLVIAPGSTDEVAQVVALADVEDLTTVPRGSGSTQDQGSPVQRADIVLDLSRLDRIVEYNPDDLTVTAEAGVTAAALAATLGTPGQWLPIDPPGAATRTLGGLAATNMSGPLRARYGTMRDLLLGVRFVQPDGVLTWGGSKVVKSVTGYDVPKLMVGALGTLGVLTELTLRLHARPEVERTQMIALPDARAAQAFVTGTLDSVLQPLRFEVFDAGVLSALGGPSTGIGAAVSFGSVETAVAEQESELARRARVAGATAVTPAPQLWSSYEARWRRAPGATLLIVGSLPAKLADTFEAVKGAAEVLDRPAHVTVGGCAVVGSLRVLIAGGATDAVGRYVERLRAIVAPWEAHVIVQAAPHAVRRAVDPWGGVPAEALALMREIKRTFDPARRLNPGRYVAGL
jgi:glycolate oxidase FAD binding subunit